MREIRSRLLAAFFVAALPAVGAANWKDRSEYDLVLKIRSEAAPQKRLELLDQWKSKFPQSELRQVRRELYLAAYQSLGNAAKMLATAEEMIGEQPDHFVGLYWCTLLLPTSPGPSTERLKNGNAAARRLLAGLDTYFAPAKKPAGTADADWKKERDDVERMAQRTIGWIQLQLANYPDAEKEFSAYLERNPKDAEISSWLGTVMILEKEPEKLSAGLWHLARASGVHGEGALSESQRKQVASLLEKTYTAYHGEDRPGLEKLLVDAAAATMPPEKFAVESAAAVMARKADEELERTNPELFAWKRMRRRLEQPDGDPYFDDAVKNVPTARLKATLMRSTPAGHPKELVVWVSEPNTEEVTIKLNSAFPNEADPGTPITFEGKPESYTKTPFSITIAVDRDKIEGWPQRRR